MARAKKHKHKNARHIFYNGAQARRLGLPPLPIEAGAADGEYNGLGGFEILQDARRLRRFYARQILKAQETGGKNVKADAE